MIRNTKIYLYAEKNFCWFLILEPVGESVAMGKAPAIHYGSAKEVLQDALWNALQQLASKPRFAIPIEILLPNRRMKRDFLTPLFNEELERIIGSDYKTENVKLSTYGRFSKPRRFFTKTSNANKGRLTFGIQKQLEGQFYDW